MPKREGGRGKACRNLLYRRRSLHLLIYVIYKAVVAVGHEVSHLAAGESELQELLNLAGLCRVLRKYLLYLLFHIGLFSVRLRSLQKTEHASLNALIFSALR